jgi:S1-C subfamily serine protease
MKSPIPLVFVAALIGFAGLAGAPAPAGGRKAPVLSLKLDPDAQVGGTAEQLMRILARPAPAGAWVPKVVEEASRGAAADVYPKVAPAIVVIRTRHGQGTGFVVDRRGWIITNNHVIQDAEVDQATGARQVGVYLGKLDGDFMRLLEGGVSAHVYKANPVKDLALLKLDGPVAGVKELPVLPFAKRPPRPGEECVAIGHPRAAMLWAVRSGQVTGVGKFPGELTDEVVTRLGLPGAADKRRAGAILGKAPQTKVLVSDCGINPGDSGGPLVNDKGEVIAVTFACARSDPRAGTNIAKFGYHVHLDELKDFLADRPEEAESFVPDPWPEGIFNKVLDLDGDGVADTLVCGLEPGKNASGALLDLRQVSQGKNSAVVVGQALPGKGWSFDLAIHFGAQTRAFYDTDGDGKIDLILTGREAAEFADSALRLVKGRWVREEARGRRMIDRTLFTDNDVRARLQRITQRLGIR